MSDQCNRQGVLWAFSLTLLMVVGAAAANAEVRAERRDTFETCTLDFEQAPAIGMTQYGFDLHSLAAERVGDIHILSVGVHDAVAEMTDMIDGEAFSHGGHRGKIRYCHHRP